MEFLIISGLSGAGKSKAASFMEDIGFYIVDNMPAVMMLKFAEFCTKGINSRYDRIALVYDVRTTNSPTELFDVMEKLKEMGVASRMLFMNATPETVIKRYKETRRRHPLSNESVSLEEAVLRERELMEPLLQRADHVIDTSHISTAQLRGEVLRLFDAHGEKGKMAVSVTSFGFKYGLPMEADLVLDVRFMPNPYYVESLRSKTGADPEVRDYVFSFPQTCEYVEKLKDLIHFSLPHYVEEGKTVLVIAIGCTGGHHRSVAVARELAGYIRTLGYSVSENHRDMTRG
ncbi:MAG: RNase adapter RapZ [Ruminococcaceae bacterium]|nr:RNase adapter RapZ [Oscillospiraceae bacterium]